MKFLISGLGSIGRRHFRNLFALGERDIVLHRTHRATLPDDELTGFPVETDLAAALAQHPHALIVANPTALHLEVAIPAAEAGCHILMEKPISNSLERVDELESALQHGGGQLLTGFQFRFHPGLRQVKQWLEAGVIGEPLSTRAHWGEYLPNWHPWEDYTQGYAARPDLGGGVVLTLSHPLDYLRWLLGEVKAVWAFTSNRGLGMPVEDSAEIGLRFTNNGNDGCLGSLHLDYNQRPPSHTLEITGRQGRIVWDNADGIARLYRPDQINAVSLSNGWQIACPPDGFERNWLFMEELRHFLAVMRGETSPICTLQDGIQALRLSLAALASARTGEKVALSS
jgi:predicted dehydrogenase